VKVVRVVCLDTHILIWAIKGEAEAGQEPMILRAQAFLRSLEEEGAQVLVPAIVLAELLVRVPEEKHAAILQEVSQRFMVVPFDIPAASEFAKLFAKWNAKDAEARSDQLGKTAPKDEHKDMPNPGRSALKADLMILATAIVRGVSCLYTNDEALTRIAQQAKASLFVSEMPQPAEQIPLDLKPDAASALKPT
jgi:predicted nucleic acid-binding protein